MILRYILVLGALALILIGCGNGSEQDLGNQIDSTENRGEIAINEVQDDRSTPEMTTDDNRAVVNGDNVSVHYTGTLDSGEQFDSSSGRDPLTFTLGTGQVIEGFNNAVIGLVVGGKVQVRLTPEEAYGEIMEALMVEVSKEALPEGITVGQQVVSQNGARGLVIKDDGEKVTIDLNHPMAGKALNFSIELMSIN
tara:strand:- start:1766 stop:2350 length:585 start_codon:yes stop_codon:yes gene_type:complete